MTRLDTELPTAPAHEAPEPPDGAPGAAGLLELLTARQQEAVRLKFQGGLSYREIAEVMDTTVSNVGVLLHEAMKSPALLLHDLVIPRTAVFGGDAAARQQLGELLE